MKQHCEDIRLELPALARGELVDPRRAAVEEHLRECSACTAIQETDAEIDAVFACDVAPGAAPGFVGRVRAALDLEVATGTAPAERGRLRRLVLPVALLAASVLVAVGVWHGSRPNVADEEVVANLDVIELLELARSNEAGILDLSAIAGDPALEALLRSTSQEEF